MSQDKIGRKELGPLLRSFVRSTYSRDGFYQNLSRLTPIRNTTTASPVLVTAKELPAHVHNDLYHALRARRACECTRGEPVHHTAFIKLMKGCPDLDDDAIFDTVFSSSCRYKQKTPYSWKFIRLQIAKQVCSVSLLNGSRG